MEAIKCILTFISIWFTFGLLSLLVCFFYFKYRSKKLQRKIVFYSTKDMETIIFILAGPISFFAMLGIITEEMKDNR